MTDQPGTGSSLGRRGFTVKAVIVGVVSALLIVSGAFFNDQYLQQTPLIGNFVPPIPFAIVLLIILGWNPTVGRIPGLRFSTGELATAFGLMLLCAWIPNSSFFRMWHRTIVMPHVQADTNPEWRRYDILGHLPAAAFPLHGSAEAQAMSEAVASERAALAAGGLTGELTAAATTADDYAACLDLATLVPARQFRSDPSAGFAAATKAWQRADGLDRQRWAAAGRILPSLQGTLEPHAGAPAWSLAHARLLRVYEERLPAAQHEWDRVYAGLAQGLPMGNETLTLQQTPFAAWMPAVAMWAPLVICFAIALLALALVVHKQWSHHEQITYPIAAVATALLAQEKGHWLGSALRSRLFWFAFIPVLAIHGLNLIATWHPGSVPSITLHWRQWSLLMGMFPSLGQAGGVDCLAWGDLFFSVIGLAYFITSGISFGLGVAGFAVVLFSLQFYAIAGKPADIESARSGAYLGYAAILLYTGRHYYWAVLLKALHLRRDPGGEDREPVWAARFFLLAFAGLVAALAGPFQLGWTMALAYGLLLMTLFLVLSRIVCESGMPFIQASWAPAQLLASVLGIGAIGPGPLVIIYWLGTVLTHDPRESLMPFAANAFKVAEQAGVGRLRLATAGGAAILLALAAGFIATTWGMYNFGSGRDGWAQAMPIGNLDEATREVANLSDAGGYAASATAGLGDKLGLISGDLPSLGWIGFGIAAVVLCSSLRFRFTWFPIHPILFLVWGSYPAMRMWLSMLIGWGIKELIVRLAGGGVYQRLKPLFIGLIVGELVAVIITIGTAWLSYAASGRIPRTMLIFPG